MQQQHVRWYQQWWYTQVAQPEPSHLVFIQKSRVHPQGEVRR